jgi:hypothetical protein
MVALLALLARDADGLAGEPSLSVRVDFVHGGDLLNPRRRVGARGDAARAASHIHHSTPRVECNNYLLGIFWCGEGGSVQTVAANGSPLQGSAASKPPHS